jgi:cation transport ATPase
LASVEDFESVTGIGVRGRVDEHDLALGNTALMDEPESMSRHSLIPPSSCAEKAPA